MFERKSTIIYAFCDWNQTKMQLSQKKSHKSNKRKLPFGLLCETKRENIVKFSASRRKISKTKCSVLYKKKKKIKLIYFCITKCEEKKLQTKISYGLCHIQD